MKHTIGNYSTQSAQCHPREPNSNTQHATRGLHVLKRNTQQLRLTYKNGKQQAQWNHTDNAPRVHVCMQARYEQRALTPKAKTKAQSLTGDAHGYYRPVSGLCSKYYTGVRHNNKWGNAKRTRMILRSGNFQKCFRQDYVWQLLCKTSGYN